MSFLAGDPRAGFLSLGSVVLAITGAEALYADMGHFGRKAITRAWLGLVFPALVLNYMGQGALILDRPATVDNPFFRPLPAWSQISMVVLATVATIIASQAVISGAFSLTQQAVQLGFLPRVTIRHTSSRVMGQIYVPAVNWFLLVAVIGLVLGFRSSSALASAYGIAVTGTFATNTLLAFVLFRVVWRKPLWMTIAGAAVFLTIELTFFAANLTKIVSGGWLPLVVGAGAFTVLTTWRRGRAILARETREDRVQLRRYLNRLIDEPPLRVAGDGRVPDELPRHGAPPFSTTSSTTASCTSRWFCSSSRPSACRTSTMPIASRSITCVWASSGSRPATASRRRQTPSRRSSRPPDRGLISTSTTPRTLSATPPCCGLGPPTSRTGGRCCSPCFYRSSTPPASMYDMPPDRVFEVGTYVEL